MKKILSKHTICPALHKGPLLFIVVSFLIAAWLPVSNAEEVHEAAAHSFNRHHTAVIISNTQNDHGEHGLTVGVDYVYRFNPLLGLGGLVEYAGGDFGHLVIAAPLFISPYKNWFFVLAPGTEVYNDEETDAKKRQWLARVGVSYRFHIGERYSIAPEFNVDVSEHETLYVYGFAFGYGW